MSEYVGDEQELVDRQTVQDWSMSPGGHVVAEVVAATIAGAETMPGRTARRRDAERI